MRISDWSSDVCSSDLTEGAGTLPAKGRAAAAPLLSLGEDRMADGGGSGLKTPLFELHRALGGKLVRSEERREGKSVSVRVDLGGRRIIKKKTHTNKRQRSIEVSKRTKTECDT